MKIIGKHIPPPRPPLPLGYPQKLLLRIRMMEIFKPVFRVWGSQGSGTSTSIVRKASTVVCVHSSGSKFAALVQILHAPVLESRFVFLGLNSAVEELKKALNYEEKMQKSIKFHCNKLPRSLRERKRSCDCFSPTQINNIRLCVTEKICESHTKQFGMVSLVIICKSHCSY